MNDYRAYLIYDSKKNYLYHHGVLGMHWGIRRYQNPDGTWKPGGLEHLKKITGQIQEDDTEKSFKLNKNQEFQRITSTKEKNDHRRTYVSFKENDNAQYILAKDELGAHEATMYKSILQAKSDLNIAGKKDQIETMIELFKDMPINDYIKEESSSKKIFNNHGKETKFSKEQRKQFETIFREMPKNKETLLKAFDKFNRSLMNDTKYSKEYLKRLSQKGFEGLIDFNDKKNFTESPLIIIDRLNSLKDKSISEITYKDEDAAILFLNSLEENKRSTK